jgi:hypothetical protein
MEKFSQANKTESGNKGIKIQKELAESILKAFAKPTLKGIPIVDHPESEVLAVPQRAYGYLTSDIMAKYGKKALQTGGIFDCVCIAGYNKNGCFLAHLDSLSADGSIALKLADILGGPFNSIVFSNYVDDEGGQAYAEPLVESLKMHSLTIVERRKSVIMQLNIGIALNGDLFHPERRIKNDCFYGGEEKLASGALPEDINYRTSLGCINEMEGIL